MVLRGMPTVWRGRHRLIFCWLIFMQAVHPGRKTLEEMRMVKKLELDLTAEVTTSPSPTRQLAYGPPNPAYSPLREGGTGEGGETYELAYFAGIHYGDC